MHRKTYWQVKIYVQYEHVRGFKYTSRFIEMKNVKKILRITVAVAGFITAVSIFASVSTANYSDKIQIRLAHNQSKASEIAEPIALFSDYVAQTPYFETGMLFQVYS